MYVTYLYYVGNFGGNTIPEADFTRLELKARVFIDNITFNRLQLDNTLVTESVKNAICEIMEVKYKITNDGGIKSAESVGNTSTTYVIDSTMTEDKQLYNIAKLYLSNTDLLYRGV